MGRNVEMMEDTAAPVIHQTLAAWRSALVTLRDEERRRGVRLSPQTGRLLEIEGQALAQGGGILPPAEITHIETLTAIGAQFHLAD